MQYHIIGQTFFFTQQTHWWLLIGSKKDQFSTYHLICIKLVLQQVITIMKWRRWNGKELTLLFIIQLKMVDNLSIISMELSSFSKIISWARLLINFINSFSLQEILLLKYAKFWLKGIFQVLWHLIILFIS
jgi:hypothetical protein